ncbi:hypothetical protein [Streptomyces sp. NPDC088557]|uniref:hypothetical protein n=1 Tax=Streptomyces sp. NPDC088557 TaxID=3365867 RepID=UPI00380CC1A0
MGGTPSWLVGHIPPPRSTPGGSSGSAPRQQQVSREKQQHLALEQQQRAALLQRHAQLADARTTHERLAAQLATAGTDHRRAFGLLRYLRFVATGH